MNKTTGPSAHQLLATRPIGLTSGAQAGSRKHKPMTDQEITTAFEKLNHLHSYSGEAVGQFAAIGAIRQIIFRPGSSIIVAYERDAREARDAVKLLGDPKATALMEEIVNLTQRMIQFEAALPPFRPDSRDLKRRHANYNATAMSTPPSPCKLS